MNDLQHYEQLSKATFTTLSPRKNTAEGHFAIGFQFYEESKLAKLGHTNQWVAEYSKG